MLIDIRPRQKKPSNGSVQVDWTHPLARKLAGMWLLGESTFAIDLTQVNTQPRTLTGTPGSENRPWGTALRLSGTTESMEIPINSTLLDSNTPWSVSSRFVFNAAPTAIGHVVNLAIGGTNAFSFVMRNVPGVQVAAITADGVGAGQQVTTGSQSANTVLHNTATGTKTSGTITNYFVNQVKQTATSTTARTLGAANYVLTVGRVNGGTVYEPVSVDYVAFWTRELTIAEILWMQSEPYGFLKPLPAIRYWSVPISAVTLKSAIESLAVRANEQTQILGNLFPSESTRVGTSEAQDLFSVLAVAESMRVTLQEAVQLLVQLDPAAETLQIRLSELVEIVAIQMATDSVRIGAQEAVDAVVALISQAETLRVTIQDLSDLLTVTLSAAETLRISVTEVVDILVLLSPLAETLRVGVVEFAEAIIDIIATESLRVSLTEVADALRATVAVSENLTTGFQEDYQRLLITLSIAETLRVSIDEPQNLLVNVGAVETDV